MTLLSYPQNVSVAGIKQADHFSTITELPNDPSSFLKNVFATDYICEHKLCAYNDLIHDCAADGPAVQYTEEMKELQKNSQLQKKKKKKSEITVNFGTMAQKLSNKSRGNIFRL